MDFRLDPPLEELRRSARSFADDYLAPRADDWDARQVFPREAIEGLRDAGFMALSIPKAYGGAEEGNLALCLVLEEINRVCASTGVTVSVHNSLASAPLVKWGTPEQKERYLPKLASCQWLGAYCLSEAGAGSDAAALRCLARKEGGHYVLDGAKLWITTGEEAELLIVFARTGKHRTRGISAFLVERSFGGVRSGKKEDKLGIRASPTNEILLEGCRVSEENRLGEEGMGFTIALDTLDGGRLGIASQSIGIAAACLEHSVTFTREATFADAPLADQQLIQWKLADMAAELEAARLLTWKAAWLRDAGQRCTAESAMAKLTASRACNRAAREAVRIHGLEGCARSRRVERFLRDARITEIYEGVTDIQRLVLARELLKE